MPILLNYMVLICIKQMIYYILLQSFIFQRMQQGIFHTSNLNNYSVTKVLVCSGVERLSRLFSQNTSGF